MSDNVKAGQVWQHKNSGARVEVMREAPGDYAWMVRNAGVTDAEERRIPEWLLTDDYVLAIGAP